jgi:hypothetical protein
MTEAAATLFPFEIEDIEIPSLCAPVPCEPAPLKLNN